MKKNKIGIIFIILLLIITIGGFLIIKYLKENKQGETLIEEITPQEEISSSQARQTIITLYFQDKDTGELVPEARLIDIKEILNTPVETLINLLISGPKSDKQERLIPEGARLEKNYLENDLAVLEFSNEFICDNLSDEKFKNNLINSIKNTLIQLTEINNVKILIDENELI